jgi:hypothetical protein
MQKFAIQGLAVIRRPRVRILLTQTQVTTSLSVKRKANLFQGFGNVAT